MKNDNHVYDNEDDETFPLTSESGEDFSEEEEYLITRSLEPKTPPFCASGHSVSYLLNVILGILLLTNWLSGRNENVSTSQESPSPESTLVLDAMLGRCDILRHTMKYSPECNNVGEGEPRRILITSVGRSGTGHLVQQMRAIGIQVSHDNRREYTTQDSPDGAVSWLHAFAIKNCRDASWGWRSRTLKHDLRYFHHVLHLVRDPLLTMRSRWNMGVVGNFVPSWCHTVPMDKSSGNSTKDTIRATLRHWVLWNSFIETYAEDRFRSEDVDAHLLHDLHSRAFPNRTAPSIDSIDETLTALTGGSNSGHTKKPKYEFTWDMLYDIDPEFTTLAQLMAVRYGYDLAPEVAVRYPLQGKKQHCGFVTMGAKNCEGQPYGCLPIGGETKWTCSLVSL